MLRSDSENSDLLGRSTSNHEVSNMSETQFTPDILNYGDRSPFTYKVSNVSERPPNISDISLFTHTVPNVSERPSFTHKASSNVSDRPPFKHKVSNVSDRSLSTHTVPNISERSSFTHKASNVSDRPPFKHKVSNVSDRTLSTHTVPKISERPSFTHKATNVSDRPPIKHKSSNVSDRTLSTHTVPNASERRHSKHKASNVSDRPPYIHKVSNMSERPPFSHQAANVSDRPPFSHKVSNASDRTLSIHKASVARPQKKDIHLPPLPEKSGFNSSQDNISVISKESRPHSSLKERTKPGRVTTVERIPEESGERRSQWELLMRKFSEDCKVRKKCRLSPSDYVCRPRDTQHFTTGSSYTGTWNILGMNGYGTYKYSNGVEYEGEFFDSLFHGEGVLRYPNGVRLLGRWERGVLKAKTLVFADGVEYDEEKWGYCHMPDRRFLIERETELKPGTESIMTADQPTRTVPPGQFDAGDGFFDPKSKAVFKYENPTDIIRFVGQKEQKWIEENCRASVQASVGPKESLYERWTDPTKPEGVSDFSCPPSLRESLCEDFATAAWGRQSIVTSFGRKAFIKFDPQADAEQEELDNETENDSNY